MIVKVLSSPGHVLLLISDVGVTVMVATIGAVVKLVAVKEGTTPSPLLESPILVLLFVHEYVLSPTIFWLVNATTELVSPLQNTRSIG